MRFGNMTGFEFAADAAVEDVGRIPVMAPSFWNSPTAERAEYILGLGTTEEKPSVQAGRASAEGAHIREQTGAGISLHIQMPEEPVPAFSI